MSLVKHMVCILARSWLNQHMGTHGMAKQVLIFSRIEHIPAPFGDCTPSNILVLRNFVINVSVTLFSPLLIFFEVIQQFHAHKNFIFVPDFQERN